MTILIFNKFVISFFNFCRWWQALLEGEELLEMSQIEAVRPMEELDQEEQMKIQELCWNEERKRQGLPTSEDMVVLLIIY